MQELAHAVHLFTERFDDPEGRVLVFLADPLRPECVSLEFRVHRMLKPIHMTLDFTIILP